MPEVKIGALVLAGGKGTRMHSPLPKVLQPILHEPMLYYVYNSLCPVFNDNIWTIVGHCADAVKKAFPQESSKAIFQEKQLGTGHALTTAWPSLVEANLDYVLVVNGDTPQLETSVIRSFLDDTFNKSNAPALSFISLLLDDPGAYGRVIRTNNKVSAIIEAKDDVSPTKNKKAHEVNAGIYCLHMPSIEKFLSQLSNNNNNNEFYITDLIGLAVEQNLLVEAFPLAEATGIMGVNNPKELVESEEGIREKIINQHLENGVTIRNASAVRISPHAIIGKGTDITGPCEVYGKTVLGEGCNIESHCKIINSTIECDVTIRSYSYVEDAVVAKGCTVGPFARLRPGAQINEHAYVGNFVEIKKSIIGSGTKVNHLSYIGDAIVGEKTNIGAGTITCNYDGVSKHTTRIGDNAFIGSNTALVAPVTIGNKALIAAGSVITENVADNMLGIARERQTNTCWKKSSKK